MYGQKTNYRQYCQAKKTLHLTTTWEESQIIQEVVQKHPVSIKVDDETRVCYSGRMGDDYQYYPMNLVYGKFPSDEVMFPEKTPIISSLPTFQNMTWLLYGTAPI